MRRKAKGIITETAQLDYISPCKNVHANSKDLYYLMSKTKIIEQIILPVQQQMDRLRRAELAKAENYSPTLKKTTRTVNTTQSDSKHNNFRKSWIHSAHVQLLHLAGKNNRQTEKQLFQRIIFIRKNKLSTNVRVVSLGSQHQQNFDDGDLLKRRCSNRQKRLQTSKGLQQSPKYYHTQSPYTKPANMREQFKKLNTSLLSKLKQGSQKKERGATQRLKKTLKQFMAHQGQV